MPIYLKQSTASQEIPLGVFVDDVDGRSAETGLTIANTDIKLWKSGTTTLASKNSGGATHISSGIYYTTLDDTDTDTLGPLVVFVHVSGALPIREECVVLAANVYDSMIVASDKLDINVETVASNAVNGIADGVLTRDSSTWEASAPVRSLGTAVMKAVHKTEDDAGTLKIYRSNNTTVHASQTITTNTSNEPIDALSSAS